MANNDNTVKNKVSTHIQNQLPEFIQSDHPVFSQFVKLYYQFLESAEVTFSEVNNYIREETESVNFVISASPLLLPCTQFQKDFISKSS